MGTGRDWRDFFYFSKADRRVMLVLAGVLAGVALSALCSLWLGHRVRTDPRAVDSSAYAGFFDSLQKTPDVAREGVTYAQEKVRRVETFEFDPNTADSTTLLRLGLSPWQVRNIYKYRARGGRYHRPEDFSRLYGLTKGDYDRLRPYIRIAEEFRLMSELYPEGIPAARDSVRRHPRREKFPEGTTVDLNAADTATLKKIPGIGPYYARRIVDYRNRLGGFVAVAQLAEVGDLPEGLERWFTVSPSVSRPLYVNRMSLNALRRHPYLNFYQSKVIVEHRRKYGAIKSLQALSLYEEFAPSDLERLQPYVSFEQ